MRARVKQPLVSQYGDAVKRRELRRYYRRADVKVLPPAYIVNEETAAYCAQQTMNIVQLIGLRQPMFIDPYALDSSFLDALPEEVSSRGYSLKPTDKRVYYGDYLSIRVSASPTQVFFGRPAVEEQSLAALNKALTEGGVAALILPRHFKRFKMQSQVKRNAKLLYSVDLTPPLFRSTHAPKFTAPHVFQVWATITTALPDKRIKEKPNKQHPDFKMRHYTGKGGVESYLSEPFSFAIDRGGARADFSRRYYTKQELDPTRQYILFTAGDQEVLTRLLSLDYAALVDNTVIPHMRYLRATEVVAGYSAICAEQEQRGVSG